jgi:hypothetical protein
VRWTNNLVTDDRKPGQANAPVRANRAGLEGVIFVSLFERLKPALDAAAGKFRHFSLAFPAVVDDRAKVDWR